MTLFERPTQCVWRTVVHRLPLDNFCVSKLYLRLSHPFQSEPGMVCCLLREGPLLPPPCQPPPPKSSDPSRTLISQMFPLGQGREKGSAQSARQVVIYAGSGPRWGSGTTQHRGQASRSTGGRSEYSMSFLAPLNHKEGIRSLHHKIQSC